VPIPLQALHPTSTGFSLIGHLELDSELDLDMDLHLDEPAFPNAAGPAPLAASSRRTLSVAVLTTQYKALDLPFTPIFLSAELEGSRAAGRLPVAGRSRDGDLCSLRGGV
jgi:hypothetical protein